jgi:hypothetical protein
MSLEITCILLVTVFSDDYKSCIADTISRLLENPSKRQSAPVSNAPSTTHHLVMFFFLLLCEQVSNFKGSNCGIFAFYHVSSENRVLT